MLLKGGHETDTKGESVHFGVRLKTKLESKPDYAGRKELVLWGRETVRTGNKIQAMENGELRNYYGQYFSQAGEAKGMMVIVSVRDGEAFNIFRAPRKYLRSKGLSAKESPKKDDPGEQPPVAVLRAMAAAGDTPDYTKHSANAVLVNQLAALAAVKDDALFAKQLAALLQDL